MLFFFGCFVAIIWLAVWAYEKLRPVRPGDDDYVP